MKSAWTLSASKMLPTFLRARGVRAFFVPTCRYAATVLNRLALLALVVLAVGSIATAQTAHFFMSESILPTPTPLYYPAQVAVDTAGNIYIADQDNYRVVKETPAEGGFIETSISTGTGLAYGVAVDQSGNIFIACNNFSYLIKETPTPTGYVQSTFGSDLFASSSVAVDSQGRVYVAAYSELIVETPSAGGYVQSGIPLAAGHGVFSVAVDSNFNLYITGLDANYLGHVWKLTPSVAGYTQVSLATNPSGFGELAVDGAGNIYVANGSYSDILVLNPSGGGYNEGQLPQESFYFGYLYMFSVAVDKDGDVFFIDYFNALLGEYSSGGGNAGPVSANSGYSSQYPVSEFFSIDTASTLGTEGVVTEGSNSAFPDFYDAGTGSCEGGFWSAGDVCSVDVYFQPTAIGDRYGAAVLYDGSGNTIATGYAHGIGQGPLVNFGPGTPIVENILSDGSAVAVDTSGALYTVAPGSSTAFKDSPGAGPSGWTEVPIGSGLSAATGIAIDGGGNLYIADQANQQIVKETLSTNGYSQSVIANQSNGLNKPTGVAVDASGNIYVSDPGTNTVLKETLLAGVYTQSMLPTSALNQPNGVTVDAAGNVYIADTNNNRVLKETLAEGGYTESALGSGLSSPTAVAVDAFGNVYISETTAGEVFKETLAAGSYVQSTMASGITPYGLAVDSNLNLYIAGSNSQLLVKLDVADAPTLSFASTSIGQVSSDSPKAITLSNEGNAPLTLPVIGGQNNPYIASGYLLDQSAGADCPVVPPSSVAAGTLTAGASCLLSISFSPLSAGPDIGNLTIFDNNLNAPAPNYISQTITLLGAGAVIQAQTINFPAISPQTQGAMLNLTATASSGLAVNFASLTPATCMVTGSTASLIAGGTCTIQASQAGNNQYSAAPNVSQSFNVNLVTQTITFSAIAAQSAGTMLNLSATATSGLAVNFASLTPATCMVTGSTASLIAGGTCTIQASQAGNNQYSPAPNVSQGFNINLVTQTITFSAIAAQTAGTTLSLAATASSGLLVSFSSSTPAICTVTGSTASTIAAGNCTIKASQAGNNQYSAAPNVSQSFMVSAQSQQTITFPAIAAQNIGATLNLSASASSGLLVSFSSSTPFICTVSGGTASMVAPGNCIIEASQAGNAQYAAAPNVNRLFAVNLFPQAITFAAIAAQNVGATLNLSASASSGLLVSFSSGTHAVCTVNGNSASMVGPGNCIIEASQPGNAHYAAAPNFVRIFAVSLAPQSITFAAIAAQNIGATLNLSATASSGLPVSFSSTTPAICTVSGNSASLIAPGGCTIEASQPGNGQYAAAPNFNRIIAVKLFPQTITFAAIGAQNIGATLNLSATASSGLPVSFSSTNPAICTVSGSSASLIAPGNCTIEASQAGNGHYAVAPNVTRTFAVNLLPQTITFAAIATQNKGITLNLSATASSGLPVGFLSQTPAVCTVSGNSASLIAAGNCIIRASQAGNGQYAAAPIVNRIFKVNP